jgi:hypothetical protein
MPWALAIPADMVTAATAARIGFMKSSLFYRTKHTGPPLPAAHLRPPRKLRN